MNIQVLVSTMHQRDYSLLSTMNIQTDAVVINQCDKEGVEEFQYNKCSILWINTTERGLSKSRNMALRYATADICILADDDLIYRDNYEIAIKQSFEQNPKMTILIFQVEGIERKYKNYPQKARSLNYINAMKVSSVEVAFRRKEIIKNNVFFDELFGAGTRFLMGEENIFISQLLKQKLKGLFVPKIIANLHIGNSSWFPGYNKEYFIGKGAAFAALQSGFTWLLILQFALRKHCRYKKEMSLCNAIKLMFLGKKEYRKCLKIDKRRNDDN